MDLEKNAENERLPLVTAVLVAINVLAFIYTEINGSSLDAQYMIEMGAMYEPAFLDGQEYYRIVTHFFLHFGMEHLFNNMVSLLVLGYALENEIGRCRFAVIYMFSGVFAGIVSVAYNVHTNEAVVSCGASGAIYGLMGALFVMLLLENRTNLKGQVPRFALYIVLSLYTGMRDPGIDNAAHIGGFVGGIIICIFLWILKRIFTYRKGQVVS